MKERKRRAAENEAVFREVNEQIESLNRGLAEISDEKMHIVCECGDLTCVDQLVVPIDEYERIRSDPTLFFVIAGHEQLDVENVVEQSGGYVVVRKQHGEAARIAKESYGRDG